jgi:PAS domain S-box-containing protein
MKIERGERVETRAATRASWLCIAGSALGALGLIGWLLDWPLLTTFVPGQPAMKPNTGLALVLLGLAGALCSQPRARAVPRALAAVAASAVLAVGIGTLAEYVLAADLGLDGILLQVFGWTDEGPFPGRVSPPTAFALSLLAAALLVFDTRPAERVRPSEWLVLVAAFAAFVALVGFLFGAGPLYRVSGAPVTGVSMPTAAALLAIAGGLLLARPDAGVMQIVTSPGPGGTMLRRLALVAVPAPVIVGPLVVNLLTRVGVEDVGLTFAVVALAMTAVTLSLLWVSAPVLDRIHAELVQSRNQLRDLIDQAPDGIFVTDADGRYVDVNDAGCRMIGFERHEVLGKTIMDLIAPADLEQLDRAKAEMLQGRAQTKEWALRRKDGGFVPVEINARLLADGRLQGFVRDTSERKRAEEQLRQSQERLELALRGADLAAWDWNVKTGEVIFNARWAEMRGFRPDEVAPSVESWYENVHPDDVPNVERVLSEHFGGVIREYETEHRVRTKSGDWLWILDRGKVFVRDEHGRPVRMVGTELDITVRKQLALEERFLGELAAVLASTLDLEQTLENVARLMIKHFTEICIVEPADDDTARPAHASIASRVPLEAAVAATLRGVPRALRRLTCRTSALHESVLMAGESLAERLDSVTDDERERRALRELSATSLLAVPLTVRGNAIGVLVLIGTAHERQLAPRDVSLVAEAARRVAVALDNARLYRQAIEATRARDELLGIVAHDLRNPLTALLVETLLLRRQGAAERGLLESVEAIEHAAARMRRFIDDLLDLTRIEAGHLVVERAPVSVPELLAECMRIQKPLAEAASLELRLELESDLPAMHGDRHRLLQVLENLLGNAVKFTPPRGTIVVGAARAGSDVRFRVSDTGPGILPEHVAHLFGRFWQARPGERRGAGLGLPIVKGIVEAHGGHVTVESAPGSGATFIFTIPIAADSPDDIAANLHTKGGSILRWESESPAPFA